MKAEILTKGVINKYSQPLELEAWSQLVAEGLSAHELAYIDRYFRAGERLLDVGCGGGRECIALSLKGLEVVAIDLVAPLVSSARRNSLAFDCLISYAVMNASVLGFKEEAFDGVLMLAQVLACIPFKSNRLKALAEVHRVLKPGGRLVLTSHSRNCHWKYQLYFSVMDRLRRMGKRIGINTLEPGDRFASKVGSAASPGRHYMHMYSLPEMVTDLGQAGFRVIESNSRREVEQNRISESDREKDYYLIYAAVKDGSPSAAPASSIQGGRLAGPRAHPA